MSRWQWSVSYETATIARGFAPTEEDALALAEIEEHRRVLAGLNPDKLAWHVSEVA